MLDAERLRKARLDRPTAGLLRSLPRVTMAPSDFRADAAPLVIVEDDGGFALGGNKVRQLDLVLGSARGNVSTLVAAAGPHSNLLRVLGAAAAHLGLQAYLVLRGTPPLDLRGNQVLYELVGAQLQWVDAQNPFDPLQDEAVRSLTHSLQSKGHRVRIVDVRGEDAATCALAATGLLDDVELKLPWIPTHAFLAAGAGGTAAGLLLALAARGWDTVVVAVSVNVQAAALRQRILKIALDTCDLCDLPRELIVNTKLEVTDAFVGEGYEAPTVEALEAIKRTGEKMGIFLDPTYTGKAMAALLAHGLHGRYLYVHTGGIPALFNHTWRQGGKIAAYDY